MAIVSPVASPLPPTVKFNAGSAVVPYTLLCPATGVTVIGLVVMCAVAVELVDGVVVPVAPSV